MNSMIKQLMIAFFAGFLLTNTALAQERHAREQNHPITRSKKPVKIQYGIASFYANKFNGRKMANGGIFNQKNLTAASNTLPLNTWVRVINLRNKESVMVKITDRMHKRNKRIIDLSRASAHKLDFTGWGLARVKVEVLGKRNHMDAIVTVEKSKL
jgi:rare lipoprotein A